MNLHLSWFLNSIEADKPLVQVKFKLAYTSISTYNQFDSVFSQVDPIVASFSGGAVGVISALMLIEANNVEQQEKKRCKYCYGSGKYQCAFEDGFFHTYQTLLTLHLTCKVAFIFNIG